MPSLHLPLTVILITAALAGGVLAAETGTVNRMQEWSFTSTKTHGDPFNEVQLDVLVTSPDGAEQRVPAFWAGGQSWKARYSSPRTGTYRWKTDCSDKSNASLHGVEGSIELKPYTGDHPLYRHGFVKVAANKRHLQYADGTPFFWLGDTWWMGLCDRLRWPEDVKTLAADRKAKGFNVIQIVAGLYPDMHPFDERGRNEGGFPWEKDYARINPAYFDAADERLKYLVDEGFTPCIVGAWGYFMPWMGVDKAKQHWRYLIARYGAMPVVWCAAGEANLNWYLAKPFPVDDRKQVTDWTEVLRYIRATDPYRRPLTIHPTGIGRLSARNCTDDVNLLDFDMLQTPHGQRDAVEPTVRTMRESYADKPIMPVINGEAAYEMLSDSLPTQWTRQMFWLCMTTGAAGHTYGANGIWQVNRPGKPHGPSPHHAPGVGYGAIPWQDAMNLPGSTQVSLGKKLFEQYDWQKFEPHPEWATYAPNDSTLAAAWGQWIWFDEGDPTKAAPVAKRYFRKSFDLPEGERAKQAALWLAVDDRFTAWVNGQPVGSSGDFKSPQSIDISKHLKPGRNVVAIEAENRPAPVADNPAGLIASLKILAADDKELSISSDATWRTAKEIESNSNWTAADFDDAKWSPAKALGPLGRAPWGQFNPGDSYGPFATGSDQTRIIYIPQLRPVRVADLAPGAKYRARCINPVSGKTTDLGEIKVDDKSGWTTSAPSQSDAEDWVLVIEATRKAR